MKRTLQRLKISYSFLCKILSWKRIHMHRNIPTSNINKFPYSTEYLYIYTYIHVCSHMCSMYIFFDDVFEKVSRLKCRVKWWWCCCGCRCSMRVIFHFWQVSIILILPGLGYFLAISNWKNKLTLNNHAVVQYSL